MLTQKHFLLCISLFLIIFYYLFQQFQRESKKRRASLSKILEKALTEPESSLRRILSLENPFHPCFSCTRHCGVIVPIFYDLQFSTTKLSERIYKFKYPQY